MKILLLDNYDSFTYNLVQYIKELGTDVDVVRNDEVELSEIQHYDAIILSPGPGLPQDSGKLMSVIEKYHDKKPMLGVCLGHQAISSFFGAHLENLENVYHGIASTLVSVNTDDILYQGLEQPIEVGRYHSWVAGKDDFPDALLPTAFTEDNCIMSFRHKELPLYGVQYHPESILTPLGKRILKNFMDSVKENRI